MKTHKIHDRRTAARDSLPIYDAIEERRGFVPNVYAVYGDAPDTLEGFFGLTASFGASSLSPAEREIVLITTSVHNQCHYCVAGHTFYAQSASLDPKHVAAIREGREIANGRFEALRRFAQALAERRGNVCRAELVRFLAVGYTPRQVLEVINGVALKTMSNMTANLLELPLDPQFEPFAWEPEDDTSWRAA